MTHLVRQILKNFEASNDKSITRSVAG